MLHIVSVWALLASAVSFVIIAADLVFHPQKMVIMNFVWPITALYFGPFSLWTYFTFGREKSSQRDHAAHREKPFWQQVWVGTTHCGAGCTLGDIIAEFAIFAAGVTLFGSMLLASFCADFLLAYLLGVIFQYFSIAPMRNLHGWPGIRAALKADTISLVAFEIGLFAFMAWMHSSFRPHLQPTEASYWFLMQVGMVIGFFTSFPANWWLIRQGWKEAM